jgi:hypothetical protein
MTTFRPSTLAEYTAWLRQWLAQGNQPTHFYDYPFARQSWITAERDFTTGGECGVDAASIIVPEGVQHLGGALGHNVLYLMEGPALRGHIVPVFSDPSFLDISEEISRFISAKRTEDAEFWRTAEHRKQERKQAMRHSDVGRWKLGARQ